MHDPTATAMDAVLTRPAAVDLKAILSAVSRIEREVTHFDHEIRIVVLRNVTVEGLGAFLKYHLYSSAIGAKIAFGGYGTMMQDVLAGDGLLAHGEADLIVLSLTLDEIDASYGTPGWRANDVQAELKNLFELLETRTRATIAVNTFLAPLHSELGVALAPDRSDVASQVSELNHFVTDFVRGRAPRFCLMDWTRYLALLGAEAALDQRGSYLWKAPFKKPFLNLYAQDIARIARVLKGRTKKCLVLDCDNTLWGGVLGEDGIEGIALDRNSYPGKAYYDFQTSLLHLAERGVLIALCSKNNESDVFEVLDTHPWCRLKRQHISAWRINWQDKAANIAALADELNLGLDSFVFVDDSPVECELVAKMLPDVTVLRVPGNQFELPGLLAGQGLFDTLRLTEEDRARAHLYQRESQRKSARASFAGVEDYLASLETVATIHRMRPSEIARAAQLTQKTNQFNLTTRRYTDHDLQSFAERADAAVFTLSAADRFGDLGLVGMMIIERQGREARIDTLLMSCRALGRGLEYAMVARCMEALESEWNLRGWQAEYVPTRKNGQVAEFWIRNGFIPAGEVDGRRYFAAAAQTGARAIPSYVRVVWE